MRFHGCKGCELTHLAPGLIHTFHLSSAKVLNTLSVRFAWRYLFARPSVFAINLLAALGAVLLLVGATISLVRVRMIASLPDPIILVVYGVSVGLAFGIFLLSQKLAKRVSGGRHVAYVVNTVLLIISLIAAGILLFGPGTDVMSFGESLLESVPAMLGVVATGFAVMLLICLLGALLMRGNDANVINLITSISAFGLGVGAAAVILVLSVFNGFEQVIGAMFGKFNAEIKVVPVRGKTFDVDSIPLADILGVAGVQQGAFSLEETAFFEYGESRAFGKLKGIDSLYAEVSDIDSTLIEGTFAVEQNGRALAVLGLGLRNKLNVNIGDAFEPVQVYAAKRQQRGPLDKPFNVSSVYPQGTFAIQQDYDQQYLFTNIATARGLLDRPNAASALELSLDGTVPMTDVADALQSLLGSDFMVLDRMEQDADLLRLMNIEKWLSYVILSLVLLLVSFNLIGGLWLIVLEKQNDIAILRSMGLPRSQVRGIFFGVGMLLSLMGVAIGVGLALLLYYLQSNYGLVTVPQGLVVSSYPIELRLNDVLVVVVTVLSIGLLASVPAVRRAGQIDAGEL